MNNGNEDNGIEVKQVNGPVPASPGVGAGAAANALLERRGKREGYLAEQLKIMQGRVQAGGSKPEDRLLMLLLESHLDLRGESVEIRRGVAATDPARDGQSKATRAEITELRAQVNGMAGLRAEVQELRSSLAELTYRLEAATSEGK